MDMSGPQPVAFPRIGEIHETLDGIRYRISGNVGPRWSSQRRDLNG